MQVTGTVISASTNATAKKNGGGTYPAWELIYKAHDGEVRTISKHVNDLKYKPNIKAALESLNAGDAFTLEQEKDEKSGFYNVLTLVKGAGQQQPSLPSKPTETASANTGNGATSKGNSYSASTYATAEERANTQQFIIRQSSLTNAVATLAVGAKAVNPDDVIKLAERYHSWVNGFDTDVGKVVAKAKSKAVAIEDIEDDIPA
jgi:citrate synthase